METFAVFCFSRCHRGSYRCEVMLRSRVSLGSELINAIFRSSRKREKLKFLVYSVMKVYEAADAVSNMWRDCYFMHA